MNVPPFEEGAVGRARNSYVKLWPGSIASCVTPGTPSIAFGTAIPCQWTAVGSGSSFLTTIVTFCP
jgi:hypothetical protein